MAEEWPCAEQNCWQDSRYELKFIINGAEFALPLCEKHKDNLTEPERRKIEQ